MFAEFDNKGGTDWAQKSVPQMWSMLAAHDGTAHKNLLVTWRQSTDLLIDHLSRVKRYRDNLAEAWPPDKSQAAAKYLDRLDDLIGHLNSTYHAAVENHRALGAATSALVGARVKLESIYRQHLANQQELEAYAHKLQANTEVVGKYRAVTPNAPAAAQAHQLELQLQAQSVMSALSTDLAQAQLNITTPALYEPAGIDYESRPFYSQQPSPSPSSKAGVTGLGQPSTNTAEKLTNSDSTISVPTRPGLAEATGQSAIPPAPNGPVLSGIIQPTSEVTPHTATPPPYTDQILTPTSGLGTNTLPESSLIPRPGNARSPQYNPAEVSGPKGSRTASTFPGGMIGGQLGSPTARPGSGTARTQRVNPSGGMIGGYPGSQVGPRRHSKTQEQEAARNRWDPENPWEIAEGNDPVLLPPEKREIDPGPAIGLT